MGELIHVDYDSGIPLIGLIAFGIIDRGTNLLQVRPTTVCNLRCVYCSTNANNPNVHPYNFVVDKDYLVEYVKKAIDFKGPGVEANIDAVGEPLTYPQLVDLVKDLGSLDGVSFISMQSNGTLLTKGLIKKLDKAGLGRLNLSVNTFDSALGKKLSGQNFYDVGRIKKLIPEFENTGIELLLAPILIPGVNEPDIREIIRFAIEHNVRLGIQKYETYKYSRKIKGVKPMTYWKFFNYLKGLEKEFGVDLVLKAKDLSIEKRKSFPLKFKRFEKFKAKVMMPGWWSGQKIAVARNRSISVVDSKTAIGKMAHLKMLEVKNNIYVAEEF